MFTMTLKSVKPSCPTLGEWDERLTAWKETPDDSELGQQVERAMVEFLGTVKCWCSLVSMHDITFPESTPRRLVISRMRARIQAVTGDNVPKWFNRSLKNQANYPSCLAMDFRTKAVELFRQPCC